MRKLEKREGREKEMGRERPIYRETDRDRDRNRQRDRDILHNFGWTDTDSNSERKFYFVFYKITNRVVLRQC